VMNRGLVGMTFALLTLATFVQAVEHVGNANSETPAQAVFIVGYWVLKTGVVAAFCWAVMRRAPAKAAAREPVAFVACTAAILGAVALQGPAAGASTGLLIAGEAVALLSCAFLLASVLALGTCFGVLPEARGLVTRGPYGLVRHPVYLGELGACAGLVLGAPTAWNLCAAGVLLAAQLVRMRLEEQALARAFPEYAAYAARTPRLLPSTVRLRPVEVS
jgi:protein-S-isoprenylcysteine O-methyltransferase Ste14